MENNRKQLMTHIVVGYPSIEINKKTIAAMCRAGVGYIELQIPFTDPIADGPTIVTANQISLENKTTVAQCFELMEDSIKKFPNIKFLFMSYYNIPFSMGVENFVNRSKEMGVYGAIVPDVPPEEDSENYLSYSKKSGFHQVAVISPTTSNDRLRLLAKNSSGLVYSTSKVGITGKNSSTSSKLSEFVLRAKEIFNLPVAVGFGIDSATKAKEIAQYADIIVIGSKVLKLINENPNDYVKIVEEFLKNIIDSINN